MTETEINRRKRDQVRRRARLHAQPEAVDVATILAQHKAGVNPIELNPPNKNLRTWTYYEGTANKREPRRSRYAEKK